MSSYLPTPQRKACDCSDPCISTDDVYYAGPNLPNSGINTYNVLTEVIEKLDAIYAVPTLQKVTEAGNLTTLPIIADSFAKIGGDGSNILLDDGTVLPIGDLPIPAFNPSDYDLDEFTNTGIDPFAHVSDIPAAPYKVYTALITPYGINDPFVTVLENTLGGEVDWARVQAGQYNGTLTGVFPIGTYAVANLTHPNFGGFASMYRINSDIMSLRVADATDTPVDSLGEVPVEIRVYN